MGSRSRDIPSPPWWSWPGAKIALLILTILGGLGHPSGVQAGALADPSGEAVPAVDSVQVALSIFRAGERLPDGQRVGARGSLVRGLATYRLTRPAREGESIVLLDFARHMTKEPRQLDAVALGTYVDGPFAAGRLMVQATEGITEYRRLGDRQDLEVRLASGVDSFTIAYEVRVPHRYWPFGCIGGRCSLSGAVAPLPSVPVTGGRWLPKDGRVIAPARWRVDARFGAIPTWKPGTPPNPVETRVLHGDTIEVIDGQAYVPYPSVLWGPAWRRLETTHHGIRIVVLHPRRRPLDHYPHEQGIQPHRDVPGRIASIAREVIDLMERIGRPLKTDTTLTFVHGPLRSQVAQDHGHLIMVSDQSFELFPTRRFLRFHELAVVRSSLDSIWSEIFRGTHSASVDLWLSGAVAFSMVALWEQIRDHPDEFAWDILHNFTFMPAIDRFLYTGQASFSGAYFRGSEDHMPLRNHPLWFSHGLPTGRRIHEKLLDTLGSQPLAAAYDALVTDPATPVRPTFERAYGHRLDWFFDQWLGPYPKVDYAIRSVETQREEAGWRHVITVTKTGQRPVIEPVQVLVREINGRNHYLVWNGEIGGDGRDLGTEPLSGTHRWVLDTKSPLDVVEIDPRQRLEETALPPRDNVDPLFNNRTPAVPRFLYTGAGLNVGLSEFLSATTPQARLAAIDAYAFFEGSLRRDLRRTGFISVYHDRETWFGMGGGANLWFGDKVNRQRRRARVSLSQTVEWLNGLGLDPKGGVRLEESMALIDETRQFLMWPNRGHRLWASLLARQTLRVDGGSDHRMDLLASAGWVQLWPIAHDHIVASVISAAMLIPLRGRPEFRNLLRVGGIGGLSGYVGDEVFGLASAGAQIEYRHQFFTNLHWNLLHLVWIRQVGGVLFGGATTVSDCDSYAEWFGPKSWYGQVGYGLTAQTEIFGVSPQFFRLDVAVPLVRRSTQCLGETLPDYLAEIQGIEDASRLLPPVNVNITFLQAF